MLARVASGRTNAEIADELFINFTEAALDRNIEVGMLSRDRTLAASLATHFRALIERGLLRPLPLPSRPLSRALVAGSRLMRRRGRQLAHTNYPRLSQRARDRAMRVRDFHLSTDGTYRLAGQLAAQTMAPHDRPRQPLGVVGVRGGQRHFERGVHDSLSVGRIADLLGRFSPLVFGAAYKVIDLLVEMVRRLNHEPPCPYGRWSSKRKHEYVRKGMPALLPAPLHRHLDHWSRVAALYERFGEHRHALVHRRAEVLEDDSLTGTDPSGSSLSPVSAAEQEAFAQLAQLLAAAVIAGAEDARLRNSLAWQLDALDGHHRLGLLGAHRPPDVIRQVVVDLERLDAGRWRLLDGASVHEHLRAQDEEPLNADLEAHAKDDGQEAICEGQCIDVPDAVVDFDEGHPPSWLRRRP